MAMDGEALKKHSAELCEYISDFWENIREKAPLHHVKPGFMTTDGVLPSTAPEDPEDFQQILKDVDKYVMPGVTQWQHPNFHGFFAAGCSYPSILGDMLSGAINCIGFSWNSSPSCTELEIVVMNWFARLLQLPEKFIFSTEQTGGGVIQGSSSECTLITLLAARTRKLNKIDPDHIQTSDLSHQLVCYTSEFAHSCVEKAALVAHVQMRSLKADEKYSLRGENLLAAIKEDKRKGLVPFYVAASIGTTALCSFDNLKEIGQICEEEGLWLHIDGAYAGTAAICPEYRYVLDGVEFADSLCASPHKWLMVNYECAALWLSDYNLVADVFEVNPLYLQHIHDTEIIDFRHLQIPLGRRFRALKLWFVFRLLGVKALQGNVRKQAAQAKEFEEFALKDTRFEIIGEVVLGLVCFRVKGSNQLNEELMRHINQVDRRIFMVAGEAHGVQYMRLAICSTKTTSADIQLAWQAVQESYQFIIDRKVTTDTQSADQSVIPTTSG